ncbi:Cu(I)/Ag(I) efflux system membrane fusion protein [Hydrogenivirga caldilitoris]|uniref:Cu(I)/Ag(I) efflux system membrane fusion protein n=1 Tax=Hydrogenivirga caldilitoris TaxID=246264 RepID=A0A497XT65_9AQUI|nr:efflux RND transporter periplasmic adaptor subunit [Hydrogenivirga caldilitoris]RLJ70322.1 Cu(I)/Ag(I) efflux system membrane fusion protein [Hydrogenivirga caldilitoris]
MRKVLPGLFVILGLLLSACGGNSYKEVVTLEQKGVKVTILSSDGKIKSGNNKIEVRVNPPKPLKEFYFYMPPMPGMDEMRDAASLKEIEPGVYRGQLKVSMDGPWQIRVVLEDTMLTKDVFVPLSKTALAGGGPASSAHAGHIMVKPEKLQLLGVVTEPVNKRDLIKTFSAVGYINYDLSKIYDITVRADAWVTDTYRRFVGEYVKKGTPLMRVLSPDIQIALDELRLAEKKGDPELIKKAKEKLEYLKVKEVVRAPASGVILEQKVYEGGYIKEGQTAYRIADISSVWVIAEIPFKQARYIKKGTLALITPEDNPENMIEGEVDYIFPEADHMAKTVKVRIKAKNRGIALKPNALVDVLFEVPIGEVLAVPETAVVDTGKRTLVFVEMEPGMYMPVNVKLGRKAEGFYEVMHGLKEGQKVVVKGTFLLDSEAQIRGIYGQQGGGGHHHH